jgi:hypothetical protein
LGIKDKDVDVLEHQYGDIGYIAKDPKKVLRGVPPGAVIQALKKAGVA